MSNRSSLLFLAAALLATSFARDGRGADAADPDQARLDAAMLATNNAALVNFLQLRERGEPTQGTLDQLIANLGASAPDARQQACADLVSIGTPVLPRLRALAREDGRSAALARHCVTAIEGDGRHVDHRGCSPACQPPCFACDADAPRLSSPCRERSCPSRHRGVVAHRRPQRKRDRGPGSGDGPQRRAPVAAGHGRRPPGRGQPRAASRCHPKAPSRSGAFGPIARGLGSRQGRRSPSCRDLDSLLGDVGDGEHARPSKTF